ncbi:MULTISPECIES: hypothetical protein [Methylomonas]|uniref:Tryptophan synthase subunit beta like protein n=2 Tax=Methylomonas TaxID=416 RepID=A0A140E3U7_9GAMM|nr:MULTISPECIES: hypothetical protein [Methylomonas]AMK75071.1 hypothetical protein JT25_001000 [Methylomonas denitrificans]OAI02561.1 hypothetical protein A1342_01990 [Methylomonas methanica]TCV83115.1 hypothetical protein EDE11_11070 [Methylomonas methanica]
MPFVVRDQAGAIVQLRDSGEEWLEVDNPEVSAFLHQLSSDEAKQALSATDSDMVRVIDDLVDLLVANQVLIFTELPERVQTKLLARKQLRKDVNALQNLIIDDEGLF